MPQKPFALWNWSNDCKVLPWPLKVFGKFSGCGSYAMGFFGTKNHPHLVPINPDNVKNKDWAILLEASTIVGPSSDRLRVANTTQDKKIVWRFRSLRWAPFLAVDGYDPRIHVLYFCPQLYKVDSENKLVPLPGEEIGRFVAQAVESRVTPRRPWYEPLDKLPEERIIGAEDFDTLVVERPTGRPGLASAAVA
jgi:hypothetical protein